ncbi:MAG: hypothetical protein BRC24_01080 [Parcubacteria group bacterium SW_4_46_8]|nr:MAG: hypothetical protein BRC24_01080 [Parcubacteria group bacterium SW_4_46_8]
MTATDKKVISSVNTQERKNLGLRAGDTVCVYQKIDEGGGDTRLQQFEGVVIDVKHGTEPGATFTVRRSIDGGGVEKTFPLYSPRIDKIEITKRARMRQSKLYHIRDKAARQIKRQMRRMIQVDIATESDIEAKDKAKHEDEEEADNSETSEDDENEEEKLNEDTEESVVDDTDTETNYEDVPQEEGQEEDENDT